MKTLIIVLTLIFSATAFGDGANSKAQAKETSGGSCIFDQLNKATGTHGALVYDPATGKPATPRSDVP